MPEYVVDYYMVLYHDYESDEAREMWRHTHGGRLLGRESDTLTYCVHVLPSEYSAFMEAASPIATVYNDRRLEERAW